MKPYPEPEPEAGGDIGPIPNDAIDGATTFVQPPHNDNPPQDEPSEATNEPGIDPPSIENTTEDRVAVDGTAGTSEAMHEAENEGPHIAPASPEAPPGIHPQQTPPVATAHGIHWYSNSTQGDVNSSTSTRNWCVTTSQGDEMRRGSDPQHAFSRLDYFLMMFPPNQLHLIVTLTNQNLRTRQKRETTRERL